MAVKSVLYSEMVAGIGPQTFREPDCLHDLNLDQVILAITAGREEYNLIPLFCAPLPDVNTICYRQEVMRDLEDAQVAAHLQDFGRGMATVRRYLEFPRIPVSHIQKTGWFLEAALAYCQSVANLERGLRSASLKSRGIAAVCRYLMSYIQAPMFQSLRTEAELVSNGLSAVSYCVTIQPGKFTVRKYQGEVDYSQEVEKAFEKVRRGAETDYRVNLGPRSGVNPIEARILDYVARLYPKQFALLDAFYAHWPDFVDETVRAFDREIQFYMAYLEYVAPLRQQGLSFCYPEMDAWSREVSVHDGFDLALAHSLRHSGKQVVANDYWLNDPERIIVVTGPNQGGKTTFARMFGQVHYLACLGLPVPGIDARLPLCDHILTHFEREEEIGDLRGKLQDDLVRVHEILQKATPQSIIILNEIFTSTTLRDALFLSKEIMSKVIELDSLCVWVTFVDELSSASDKTVSMVSTVDPEDQVRRTFRFVRQPANGLAYALSIARKHGLTRDQIKERIRS